MRCVGCVALGVYEPPAIVVWSIPVSKMESDFPFTVTPRDHEVVLAGSLTVLPSSAASTAR